MLRHICSVRNDNDNDLVYWPNWWSEFFFFGKKGIGESFVEFIYFTISINTSNVIILTLFGRMLLDHVKLIDIECIEHNSIITINMQMKGWTRVLKFQYFENYLLDFNLVLMFCTYWLVIIFWKLFTLKNINVKDLLIFSQKIKKIKTYISFQNS